MNAAGIASSVIPDTDRLVMSTVLSWLVWMSDVSSVILKEPVTVLAGTGSLETSATIAVAVKLTS